MNQAELLKYFDLSGTVAVVTGANGVLGRSACLGLAKAGAKVALLGRRAEPNEVLAKEIEKLGGEAKVVLSDVTDVPALEKAREEIVKAWGQVDHLLNYAGGNRPEATATAERKFFDLPKEGLSGALDLNILGTILPCQVFGRHMAERGAGNIINVSSMAAMRPLTRVVAYSAAKAAISNFTHWLSVHMAQEYSAKIRVNAIAPGFFLTEQNRYLLTDKATGELTPRGKSVIAHTPQKRFGDAEDLVSAVLWLLSPSASFVTGVVLPVDGGFAAFSGV